MAGGVQSLAVVGMNFLSPCWLLVRAVPCFWRSPASLDSWPLPLDSKPAGMKQVSSHIRSSHVSSSIASLCPTLLPSSSTFKGPGDYTGSTQTIQDNILIQRSISLIPSPMSLLLCNVTYTALTSGIRA